MEFMGVASGCGCKEVYRFPHITYPYSCICSFLQQHPYFLFIKKYVFRSLYYTYRQPMPFTPSEMLFSLVRHRNISQDTSWP